MEVERRLTCTLDKNFSFLKKNLLRLLHISQLLKMYLSSSLIISSSSAELPAAFSMLLAAITHFTQTFFNTTNSHHELRMSWYAYIRLFGLESSFSSFTHFYRSSDLSCTQLIPQELFPCFSCYRWAFRTYLFHFPVFYVH